MRIAVAALAAFAAIGASGASAAWYITGTGEDRMVVNTEDNSQSRLLRGSNGAAPGDCPAGSFYELDDQSIRSCDDASARYSTSAPGSDEMMTDGQPFPQGSMMLRDSASGSGDAQDSGTGLDRPTTGDTGSGETGNAGGSGSTGESGTTGGASGTTGGSGSGSGG